MSFTVVLCDVLSSSTVDETQVSKEEVQNMIRSLVVTCTTHGLVLY